MKKNSCFRRVLCFILALLIFAVPVTSFAEDADLSVEQGAHSIDGKIPVVGPLEALSMAPAAIMYDVTDDTIVYATDPDSTYNPAGLVKLMTGLLVAEKGNMSDMVTITQETIDDCVGSNGIDFQVGEQVSMLDLL